MAILSYRRANLLEVTNLQAAQVRSINNSLATLRKSYMSRQLEAIFSGDSFNFYTI